MAANNPLESEAFYWIQVTLFLVTYPGLPVSNRVSITHLNLHPALRI